MAGDFKLVKTNERDEKYRKPASPGSYRYVDATRKVHDLEVHHPETGEPLFSAKKNEYGKGWRLSWHPYMTDQHPELERSFEHGSRGAGSAERFTADSKDTLKYRAEHIYTDAARKGFKDEVESRTIPHPDHPTDPYKAKTTFHDRETGDLIGHTEGHGNPMTASGAYMDKHGIDRSVLKTLPPSGSNRQGTGAYHQALGLSREKGKSYTLIGQTNHFGRNFDSRTGQATQAGKLNATVFKAGVGKTDEEMSAAHERHVRDTHGSKEGFSLVRHTPTIFHASVHTPQKEGENYRSTYNDVHVTSIAHGGKLTHQQFNPSEDSNPSSTKI